MQNLGASVTSNDCRWLFVDEYQTIILVHYLPIYAHYIRTVEELRDENARATERDFGLIVFLLTRDLSSIQPMSCERSGGKQDEPSGDMNDRYSATVTDDGMITMHTRIPSCLLRS